jgi:hypothetical protein
VLSMSKQEFSRLEVLLRVQSGRLRVADACVLIGLQRRQVFRLLRGLKQDGAASLLSKHRGKPSNHWPRRRSRNTTAASPAATASASTPAPRSGARAVDICTPASPAGSTRTTAREGGSHIKRRSRQCIGSAVMASMASTPRLHWCWQGSAALTAPARSPSGPS